MREVEVQTNSARVTSRFSCQKGTLYLNQCPLFISEADSLIGALEALREESGKHLVVTPNVDQVLNLEQDPQFRAAFREAEVRTVDGAPVALLGSILLHRRVYRNTGADLLEQIVASRETTLPMTIALVGGDQEVSAEAAESLNRRSLGARVVSVPTPFAPPTSPEYTEVVSTLSSIGPDYVFLGLGSPKQERWYLEWRDKLPDAVYVGSGAAYAFSAGAARRAPIWIQRSGLEWLYRLVQEPARLSYRYLVKGPRFFRVAAQSYVLERGRSKS